MQRDFFRTRLKNIYFSAAKLVKINGFGLPDIQKRADFQGLELPLRQQNDKGGLYKSPP